MCCGKMRVVGGSWNGYGERMEGMGCIEGLGILGLEIVINGFICYYFPGVDPLMSHFNMIMSC